MSTDVHYHTQPHTLDPAKEPPENTENLPLAQGHDEDDAADVREAQAAHRDQVRSEQEARDDATEAGEPEPGAPRAPGDHAGSDEGSDDGASSDDADVTDEESTTESATETTEEDGPPSGTIEEVKAWVGDDPERAQQALDAEREGQNRQTLVSYLEGETA
jgi:hypothetical protein